MVFSVKPDRSTLSAPVAGKLLASARRLPRALLVLLLFCFVLQSTAVQSHVHFAGRAGPPIAANSHGTALFAAPGKSDGIADCALCREAATAGAYVLPSSPVLPPPPAPLHWIAPADLAAFALPGAPLGWLSRAPPE
jgi:hypothetical protein